MQVRVHVDKPVEHCYYIWLDRLNYLNWFDLISEVRTRCCRLSLMCLAAWWGSQIVSMDRT